MNDNFTKLYPDLVCCIFSFTAPTIKYYKGTDILMELYGYFKHDEERNLYYFWENIRLRYRMPYQKLSTLNKSLNDSITYNNNNANAIVKKQYELLQCSISNIRYLKRLSLFNFLNVTDICNLPNLLSMKLINSYVHNIYNVPNLEHYCNHSDDIFPSTKFIAPKLEHVTIANVALHSDNISIIQNRADWLQNGIFKNMYIDSFRNIFTDAKKNKPHYKIDNIKNLIVHSKTDIVQFGKTNIRKIDIIQFRNLEILVVENIRKHEISGCYWYRNNTSPYDIIGHGDMSKLTKLRKVILNNISISSIIGLYHITDLTIIACEYLHKISHMSKLKYLRVEKCKKLCEIHSLNAIEELQLIDCTNLNMDAICEIHSLKKLYIRSGCYNFISVGRLDNLEELVLCRCSTVKNIHDLPKLHRLHVHGMKFLTNIVSTDILEIKKYMNKYSPTNKKLEKDDEWACLVYLPVDLIIHGILAYMCPEVSYDKEDILYLLYGYFDWDDSRKLYHIWENINVVASYNAEKLYINTSPSLDLAKRPIEKSMTTLTKIDSISGIKHLKKLKITGNLWVENIEKMKSLNQIVIDESLVESIKNTPRLNRLLLNNKLNICQYEKNTNVDGMIRKEFSTNIILKLDIPSLKYLRINKYVFESINTSNVKTLLYNDEFPMKNMVHTQNLNNNKFYTIINHTYLSQIINLKKLCLNGNVTELCGLNSLEYLSISSGQYNMYMTLHDFPKLKFLDICKYGDYSSRRNHQPTYALPLYNIPILETLMLKECYNISFHNLHNLKNMSRLKKLFIRDCRNIQADKLFTIFNGINELYIDAVCSLKYIPPLADLQKLILHNCSKLINIDESIFTQLTKLNVVKCGMYDDMDTTDENELLEYNSSMLIKLEEYNLQKEIKKQQEKLRKHLELERQQKIEEIKKQYIPFKFTIRPKFRTGKAINHSNRIRLRPKVRVT